MCVRSQPRSGHKRYQTVADDSAISKARLCDDDASDPGNVCGRHFRSANRVVSAIIVARRGHQHGTVIGGVLAGVFQEADSTVAQIVCKKPEALA